MPQATASQRRTLPIRFVVLLALYLLVGNFVLQVPIVERMLIDPWTAANASAAAVAAGGLGLEAETLGGILSAGGASLAVKKGCNGVEAALIVAAAVLAFPASWSRRCAGILTGVAAIFLLNLLRLVSLLLVALYWPAQLEFFHIYVWQTLIVLLGFGIFLIWGIYFAEDR